MDRWMDQWMDRFPDPFDFVLYLQALTPLFGSAPSDKINVAVSSHFVLLLSKFRHELVH